MLDSQGSESQEPQCSTTNSQAKKNAQDWFPKWAPKWDPKGGPKLEPNWGHASCFLLTEPKTGPQNGGPKWIQKRAPKRIQNGPQKQPKNEFKHKQWSATMSNCPVSHVRTHTQKQTAAWILSKLLDTSCLRALTRNKPHVQLLETSVSTTPEECPCSPENPWFLGPQTRNLDWRTCPSYYITETRRSAAHLWLSNPHVRAHLRPSQLILRPFKVTSTTF